jgi:hypothetical protein
MQLAAENSVTDSQMSPAYLRKRENLEQPAQPLGRVKDMPRSKHRRKPGGKAVRHPGRGKLGQMNPALLQEDTAADELHATVEAIKLRTGLSDLPLPPPLADEKER